MKTLTTPQINAAQAAQVVSTALIELQLTSTLRFATAPYSLTVSGNTWVGLGALASIESVTDTDALEPAGLRLTLSGCDAAQVAIALSEPVQGRPCMVYQLFLDATTHQPVDTPILEWAGRIDQMTIQDGEGSATITLTAENRLAEFKRPRIARYTNEEQQRRFAGDRGCEYVAQMADKTVEWPSAEWFRLNTPKQ